ncbi:unnamed protein product [Rhizoctonia solani]|uniref:Secreted protein n=1 Tax=Rhizoctonia solani TaxID=456999 RepID=A0A8H3HGL2_9AGAM|nr:unnamed protein product [Rhizoctonia solani]
MGKLWPAIIALRSLLTFSLPHVSRLVCTLPFTVDSTTAGASTLTGIRIATNERLERRSRFAPASLTWLSSLHCCIACPSDVLCFGAQYSRPTRQSNIIGPIDNPYASLHILSYVFALLYLHIADAPTTMLFVSRIIVAGAILASVRESARANPTTETRFSGYLMHQSCPPTFMDLGEMLIDAGRAPN